MQHANCIVFYYFIIYNKFASDRSTVKMKKLLITLILILSANTVSAYDYPPFIRDGIKPEDTVSYSPKDHKWTRQAQSDDITFTKYMTKGSGGYSEYEYQNKQYEAGKDGSTYEFLHNGNLISYNSHQLKFYKLDYINDKIEATELSAQEVKNLFPNLEIVMISSFKNNKITLYKPWLEQKTFMLLNDTNTDFYKYQFENLGGYELIRGVFEVSKYQILPETFIFSHFGSKDKLTPPLKITVKNRKN